MRNTTGTRELAGRLDSRSGSNLTMAHGSRITLHCCRTALLQQEAQQMIRCYLGAWRKALQISVSRMTYAVSYQSFVYDANFPSFCWLINVVVDIL
jgi:hypothetical protein